MKLTVNLSVVFLIVALGLPIAGLAQNRGDSIGTPVPFGDDETGAFSIDGNRISVSRGNGYKKISVKESERDIEITIHANGRIKVDLTRQFSPDELDRLVRRAPELEKYVRSFPKQVGRNSIRLSVGLTTSVEGQDASELRDKDLAAFNIYKRYAKASSQAATSGGNDPVQLRAPSTRQIGPAIPGIENAPKSGNPLDPDAADKEGKKKNKGQSGTGIG